MITADVSKTLESLKKAHAEIVRRMENMVRGFAYEFALTAVSNTPLGDDEKYAALYQRRTYLQPIAGFARGSWQYSESGNIQEQDIYSGTEALKIIKSKLAGYKLGESFVIGNTGPYIMALESGNGSKLQAPDGITSPTIDQVMSAYKINLVRYYQQ